MIKYKKSGITKFVEIISRPPTSNITIFCTLMHKEQFPHDAYKKAHSEDLDFEEVFQWLQSKSHIHDGDKSFDYHLQYRLLYKLDRLYVSKGE